MRKQSIKTESASQTLQKSQSFRVGWSLLLLLSLASIANSTHLVFFDTVWLDGHIAWLSASAYAFIVLITSYRRQERWAWYATWAFGIPFLVFGLNHLDEPMFGPFYVGAALIVAFAQLMTWSAFHRINHQE